MRLLGISVRLLALSLPCCSMPLEAAQPDFGSDPWKLVLPQARWILGVDWARARNSTAAQVLARQFQGAESRLESSGLGLQAIMAVERIIASGSSLDMKDEDGPQDLLVAIEGTIDRAKLKRSLPAGTAVERFRGADLFVPPKTRPGEPLVALIGSRWMLVGDRAALAVILSGRGGPADASLYGRASRLATEAEIWLTLSGAALPKGGSVAASPLEALRDLDLLISLQRGLRLQASLTGASQDLARNLGGMIQSAGALGGAADSGWLRRMQFAVKGNQVLVTLDLPAAELEASIVQAKASALALGRRALESALPMEGLPALAGVGATAPDSLPVQPAEAPPAPRVRAVRIVGLEEGPKEIPYTTPPGRSH